MTEDRMEHQFTSFADRALEDPIASLKRTAALALPICKALRMEMFYSPDVSTIDAAHFTSS
jgi:hypothetical protein